MPLIKPIVDPQLEHSLLLWERQECYRYYVQQRRRHCTYRDLLDLWLLAPSCEDCMYSGGNWVGLPDITENGWEVDLLLTVGTDALDRTKAELESDPEYAFLCKRCGRSLRPWDGDAVYVIEHHLEDRYGIPLETPGRKNPPKKLRDQIIRLYDGRCFGCDRDDQPLHLDHIRPRARGGDAAFRNLQPLCVACGQRKGNGEAGQVTVIDTLYFGPYPSDAYEGLFW